MRITIPTSWEGITIKQFISLNSLKLVESDMIDYLLEVVTICCNIKYSEASKLSIDDLRKIYSSLGFIEKLPDEKIIEKYALNGVVYQCQYDISKITAGQYVDIKEATKVDSIGRIHEIMAALYLPVGKKYGDENIGDMAELFYRNMPISIAYPLAVFFCNLLNGSMPDISLYLENQAIMKTREAMKQIAELAR